MTRPGNDHRASAHAHDAPPPTGSLLPLTHPHATRTSHARAPAAPDRHNSSEQRTRHTAHRHTDGAKHHPQDGKASARNWHTCRNQSLTTGTPHTGVITPHDGPTNSRTAPRRAQAPTRSLDNQERNRAGDASLTTGRKAATRETHEAHITLIAKKLPQQHALTRAPPVLPYPRAGPTNRLRPKRTDPRTPLTQRSKGAHRIE